jgi:hypothetical protein
MELGAGRRRERKRISLSDLEGEGLPASPRIDREPAGQASMEFRSPGRGGAKSRRRHDEILTADEDRAVMQDWSWSGIWTQLTDPQARYRSGFPGTAVTSVRGDATAPAGSGALTEADWWSVWDNLTNRRYPGAKFTAVTAVRGDAAGGAAGDTMVVTRDLWSELYRGLTTRRFGQGHSGTVAMAVRGDVAGGGAPVTQADWWSIWEEFRNRPRRITPTAVAAVRGDAAGVQAGEVEISRDMWTEIYRRLTGPRLQPGSDVYWGGGAVRGDVASSMDALRAPSGPAGALDISFLDEFAREFFPLDIGGGRWTPTVFCTNLEEFVSHLVGDQESSETVRRLRAQAERDHAMDSAEHGGFVMGINMPGRGCFINGWAFARMLGHEDARAALSDPRTRTHIAATVMHEKYGHGFIDALAPIGEELTHLKSTQYYLAEVFPGKAFDTPDAALYNEKWNLVLNSMLFLQEGFSYWVAKRSVEQLAGLGRLDAGSAPRDFTEQEVFAALERAGGGEVASAMRSLLDEEADAAQTLDAVRRLNGMGAQAERSFASQLGRAPRYVLGYLLCRRIEERWGPACVPQAVLIASNYKLNTPTIANADLKRLLDTQPNLCGDARFAVIADLPPGPRNNLQALAKVCHENLNMSVPGGAPSRASAMPSGGAATGRSPARADSTPVALLDGGYGVCKCDKCGFERPPAGNPCGYPCPTGDGGTMQAVRRL